jgi:hypothetical protein
MDGRERAGEGPCRPSRSQAVLGLLALATMSVIWDNPENIYSVRVLLPMTRSGSRARHHSITSLALISLFPRSGLRA